jgi:hypothetical protein
VIVPLRNGTGRTPVVEIVVGPTEQAILAKNALDSLLMNLGMDEVEVVASEVPFRTL